VACPAGTEQPHANQTSFGACATCPSGSYASSAGAAACSDCPAGYDCTNAAGIPSVCAAGTYSPTGVAACSACPAGTHTNALTGASNCTTCPAGSSCADPAQAPVACQSGNYSQPGASSCSSCPAGHSCPTAASDPVPCSAGTYSLDGWADCVACPPGSSCADPSVAPVACAAGTHSVGGASTCSPCADGMYTNTTGQAFCHVCPAGHQCATASYAPQACPAGTFSLAGAVACSACKAGTTALNTGSTSCDLCPPGKYCASASAAPVNCSTGYVSDGGDITACRLCPTGTRSSADFTICESCPAGYSCDDPRNPTAQCPGGTWSPRGSDPPSACFSCPAGTRCSDPSVPPVACSRGTYSLGGASSCTSCPAGSSCLDPSLAPISCPAGRYSALGEVDCHECPAGSQCSDSSASPVACGAGTWSPAGALSCTACRNGEACHSRSQPPVVCHPGTYALAGDVSCTACPAGSACTSPSQSPTPCTAGTFALGGASASQCTTCPAGHYCPTTSSAPIPCSVGSFSSEGATACTSCAAGFYCPSTQSNTQVACPNGTYSLGGTARCEQCPAGFSCPNTDSTAGQAACSTGYYSPAGVATCTQCPAGYVCPNAQGTGITKCPLGRYSGAGTTSSCTICPAGQACPDPASPAAIYSCPSGSYSLGSATTCTLCPSGSACASTSLAPAACAYGQVSVPGSTACTDCPAGFHCPSAASNQVESCPAGTYSPAGESLCLPCPEGYMCSTPDASPAACGAGTYAPPASTVCIACPAGYYCASSQTGVATATIPLICPVGTWSPGGQSSCQPCTAGYYCSAGSTGPTPSGDLCPMGYYCPVSASFTPNRVVRTSCGAGNRGNKVGAVSFADGCETCPTGLICNSASTTATSTPCPTGAYCPGGSSSTGTACPSGRYNPSPYGDGLASCLTCPAGFYCASRTTTPLPCPQGVYCPTGTTNSGASGPRNCPAGRYGGLGRYNLEGAADCLNCTAGYYCPGDGTPDPIACPAGTYNPQPGSQSSAACLTCPAGTYCPNPGTATIVTPCTPGYYCPAGTGSSTGTTTPQACPAGTFYDGHNATQAGDCNPCPARFSCASATGGSSGTPFPCTAGYYCPEGTRDAGGGTYLAAVGAFCAPGYHCPCPAGRYSPATNLQAFSECLLCPPGFYCAGAQTIPSGSCGAGYFCPNGTTSATSNPCPAGTYSAATDLFDEEQCTTCPVGHYCHSADTAPRACPAGTYSNTTSGKTVGDCITCPSGYRCGASGLDAPSMCMAGNHSSAGATSCSVCPVGHYCASNTTATAAVAECPAGMFCPAGTNVAPEFTNFACPAGYVCTRATTAPAACPAGTYNPEVGGSVTAIDCITCPVGSWCGSQALTAPSGSCDPGHYCPAGSTAATEVECPSKFYRAHRGARSLSDCALCPSGFTCGNATVTPSLCPQGSYCVVGVDTPEPCKPGTFGNSTGVRRPEDCTPCPPGSYCETMGLTAPTGLCAEGYFCLAGSASRAPVDPLNPTVASVTPIGGICPPGGYCPQGSAKPEACPAGTFSNVTGAANVTVCLPCTPGSFCQGTSNPFPSGPCLAGYYCSGGASANTQHETPAGHYSLTGAAAPTPCAPGTFTSEQRQSSCKPCPAGRYCNVSATITPLACPPGSFCPLGTDDPFPCPSGRYSDRLFLENSTACSSCPPGYYCETPGLTAPEGQCSAGYYCTGGSPVRNPGASLLVDLNVSVVWTGNTSHAEIVDPGGAPYNLSKLDSACITGLTFGGPCPAGHYCLSGTTAPDLTPCPAGTYNPLAARTSQGGCLACPPGKYCGAPGLSQPTGDCAPGYFCSAGAASNKPTDGSTGNKCPIGAYCGGGNSSPQSCPPGTFGNTTGLSVCHQCPARYYCDGSTPSTFTACPRGNYCPEGTGAALPTCPRGTFNPILMLSAQSECQSCTPGKFCDQPGLQAVTGDCEAGFYCPGGAADRFGRFRNESSGDVCDPRDNGTGLVPPNNVTLTQWAIAVSGGSPLLDFFTNRAGPRVCPLGHYCPAGSSSPQACQAGTFQPVEGATHRNACELCTSGSYCAQPGLSAPTGLCHEGYYCKRGNIEPNPMTGAINTSVVATGASLSASVLVGGSPCPTGHYCPNGTATPFPCPAGTYNSFTGQGLSGCLVCPAGFYCVQGSSVYTDKPCPAGYFCTDGTQTAQQHPCPAGTFSNQTMLRNSSECVSCYGGQYCPGPADTVPAGPCNAGYYCRSRASTPTPMDGVTGDRCSPGEFCVSGSSLPTPCAGGKYCLTSSGVPDGDCFAGYYCEQGSFTPTPIGQSNALGVIGNVCPPGAFCPNGTVTPVLCDAGTFSAASGNRFRSDCQNCTAGFYCDLSGQTVANKSCLAGFYCPSGTVYPTETCPPGAHCPTGSQTPVPCPAGTYQSSPARSTCDVCPSGFFCGNGTSTPLQCPPGHYCPNGTRMGTEHPCPLGTFAALGGLQTVSQCTPCSPGMYCGATGLTAPSGACSAGHYCLRGADTPTPAQSFANGYVGSLALNCNASTAAGPDDLWRGVSALNLTGYALNTSLHLPTTGDVCPRGHYCPGGSSSPVACPAGTFNSEFAAQNSSMCEPCLAGFFCPNSSTVYPTQRCPAGSYCPTGRVLPQHTCASGHYCPEGSTIELPCAAGTFQNQSHQASCNTCPQGFWCGPQSVAPTDCPAGYYCLAGADRPDATPCPLGTFSALTNLYSVAQCTACTPGRYCSSTALTAPTNPCDAGFYCTGGSPTPNPGFNQSASAVGTCGAPTLFGSPSGSGLSTLSYGGMCPAGAFCPQGSSSPSLCPNGTLANSTANTAPSDCTPCTPGYHCPWRGTVVATLPCPPGYSCPGGQVTGNEHPCPSGHECPQGSIVPQQCSPGTYQNATTSASCKACPAGFGCPVQTSSPLTCEAGYACPLGSPNATAVPCPIGTFSNRSGLSHTSQCDQCLEGHYCASLALTAPTGLCGPGHYCSRGAWLSTPGANMSITLQGGALFLSSTAPNVSIQALWSARAAEFATGGPCNPGFVCTYGSNSPEPHHPDERRLLPWPALTTQYAQTSPSSLGANTADLVKALTDEAARLGVGFSTSFQADGVALSRLNSSQAANASACAAALNGTALPSIVRVYPLDPPKGYACPPGTYCGIATTAPLACPPGTFANSSATSQCQACLAGYHCPGATSAPIVCPRRYFCPAGTAEPVVCPGGSYGANSGLKAAAECSPCPATQFCSNGDITGPCWGGFVCLGNSSIPDPATGTPDQLLGHGYNCPAGFFCPNGTLAEVPCPTGLFSSVVGATSSAVCGLCPPAAVCTPGSPTAAACPAGNYCPGQSVVIPCPNGTYNALTSQSSPLSCLSCPAGSLCDRTGVVNPATLPCPSGGYCPSAALVPIPCPPTTYRSTVGGSALASCAQCPGGFICGRNTTTPSICAAGTYCPPGSALPTVCEPGRVCGSSGLSASSSCPAGFYCPNGTAIAVVCPLGTYCEGGNFEPVVCPAGTVQQPASTPGGRTSFTRACKVCPAGTYSDASDGLDCKLCTAGYVCLGGTTSAAPANSSTEKGYPCPAGHYCPQGSSKELPCPMGHYNPLTKKSSLQDCLACRVNSYAASEAQANCKPCSASAYTVGNASTTCICRGEYRHFQATDGQCVCQPGYEFVDEELQVKSEQDGEQDCQPQTFSVCETGQSRLASGACVTVDCTSASQCPSGRGKFVPSMGVCACDGLPEADAICGSACQSAITRVQVNPLTGRMVLTDPSTGAVIGDVDPAADIPGFVGSIGCVTAESPSAVSGSASNTAGTTDTAVNQTACRVHTMVVSPSTGFTGVYAPPTSVVTSTPGSGTARRLREHEARMAGRSLNRLVAGPRGVEEVALHEDGWDLDEEGGRRLRNTFIQQVAAEQRGRHLATVGPSVSRPAACIQQGDSLVFELPNGADSIPVYVKDSFLNTNPAFDYGEFRRLAALAAVDSASVAVFAFTFREAGTYVFASSSDSSQQTIVVVQPFGQVCPTGGAFSPPSEQSLVSLGVKETTQPALDPDWKAIFAVLGGLLGLVIIVLSAAMYFRQRAFGQRASSEKVKTDLTLKSAGESKFSATKGDAGDSKERGKKRRKRRRPKQGDDWDSDFDDEMGQDDVSKLMEALRRGQLAADQSFDAQLAAMQEMLERLRAEAETLRRMLADNTISQGKSGAGAAEAELAARRSAVCRQLEAELAARLLQNRLISKLEQDALATVAAVARSLRNAPLEVAVDVVDELFDSARDRAEQESGSSDTTRATTVAALVAAVKSLQMEDSESADDLRVSMAACREVIGALHSSVLEEENRAKLGVTLWHKAAGAGVLDGSATAGSVKALRESLVAVEDARMPHHAAVSTLLEPLLNFGHGVARTARQLREEVRQLRVALSDAVEQQNPAIAERVRTESANRMGELLEDLYSAVLALLGRLPDLVEATNETRHSSDGVTSDTLPLLLRVRTEADEIVRKHRLTRGGLQGLLDQVNKLIEDARKGKYYYGGAFAAEDEDEDAERDVDADDAGGALAKAAEAEAEAEAEAMRKKIAEEREQRERELAEEAERKRAAEARRLAEVELDEERRKKLLEMFDEDQARLAAAMEAEKRRQEQEMADRLERRKQDRLRLRMRQAEKRAAEELEERRKAAEDERRRRQDAERDAMEAELADEETRARDQAMATERSSKGEASFGVMDAEAQAHTLRSELRRKAEEISQQAEISRGKVLDRLDSELSGCRSMYMLPIPARHASEWASLPDPWLEGSLAKRGHVLDQHEGQWREADRKCEEEEESDGARLAAELREVRTAAATSLKELAEGMVRSAAEVEASLERELSVKLAEVERRRATETAATNDSVKDPRALAKALVELEARFDGYRAAVEGAVAASRDVISSLLTEAKSALVSSSDGLKLAAMSDEACMRQARLEAVGEREALLTGGLARVQRLRDQLQSLADAMEVGGVAAVRKLWLRILEEEAALNADDDEDDEAAAVRARRAEEAARALAKSEEQLRKLHEDHTKNLSAMMGAEASERRRQKVESEKKRMERRERWAAERKRRMQEAADRASSQDLKEALEGAALDAQVAAAEREAAEEETFARRTSVSAAAAEAQVAKLRASAAAEREAADRAARSERRRQEAVLAAKLAERRSRRERQLERSRQHEVSEALKSSLAGGKTEEEAEAAAAMMDSRLRDAAERQRELAAERDDAEREALAARLRDEAEAAAAEKRRLAASMEEEVAKLRSSFDSELEASATAQLGEKRRQRAAMEARLRQRRERRERELRRRQQEEAAADDARIDRELGGSAVAEAMDRAVREAMGEVDNSGTKSSRDAWEQEVLRAIATATSAASDVATEEAKKRLEADARREREELAQRQEAERKAAEAAAREEEAREAAERALKQEEERKAKLEARRKEMETAIANASAKNDSEEAARLREEFEHEMSQYESSLSEERRRQDDKLKQRLAARRERQARALLKKQEQEMEEAARRAEEKRREMEAEEAKQREKEALRAVLEGQDEGKNKGDAVELVMQERHARETSELLTKQYNEREKLLRDALEGLFEAKNQARGDAVTALEERHAKQAEIDAELSSIDATFAARQAEVEAEMRERLETRHANEQLELRMRQLAELRDAIVELAPEDVLRRREAEEAAREAKELQRFQESLEKEREDRLQRAKAEKEEFEVRLKQENEAEMKRLEEEHQHQLAEEKERQDRAIAARRERMEREQEEARKAALQEASAMDDEARQRILDEFEEGRQRLEARMEQVRRQQMDELRRRLEVRASRRLRQVQLRQSEERAKQQLEQQLKRQKEAAEAERQRKEAEERARRDMAESTRKGSTISMASAAFGAAISRASRRVMSGVSGSGRGPAMGGFTGLQAIGEGDEDEDVDVVDEDGIGALGGGKPRQSGMDLDLGGLAKPAVVTSVAKPSFSLARVVPLAAGGVDVPALTKRLVKLESALEQALEVQAAAAAPSTAVAVAGAGAALLGLPPRPPADATDLVPSASSLARLEFAKRVFGATVTLGSMNAVADPLARARLRISPDIPPREDGWPGVAWDPSGSGSVWIGREAVASAGVIMTSVCRAVAAVRSATCGTDGATELERAFAWAGSELYRQQASDAATMFRVFPESSPTQQRARAARGSVMETTQPDLTQQLKSSPSLSGAAMKLLQSTGRLAGDSLVSAMAGLARGTRSSRPKGGGLFRRKIAGAIGKMKNMKEMGIDVVQMLHATPMLDETDEAGLELDLQQSKATSSNRFEAGSLSEQLSSIRTLAHNSELSSYIASLEQEVLRGDEETARGKAEPARAATASHDGSASGYVQLIEDEADGIEEQLNAATRQYLSAKQDAEDVESRLEGLKSRRDAQERTLSLVKRVAAAAEKKRQVGDSYVEADEELRGLTEESLPSEGDLLAELTASNEAISEATKARETLVKKRSDLAERQSSLEKLLGEKRREAERLRGLSAPEIEREMKRAASFSS
jgi:hypothetical protein